MLDLSKTQWIHGAEDCTQSEEPAVQIVAFDTDTYILRQNHCTDFEAPFLYLLFGKHTALLLDTGATASAEDFPLRQTVETIMASRQASRPGENLTLLIAHSHGHGDHVQGDTQFWGRPNTSIVATGVESVAAFFEITHWPSQVTTYDLGERTLDVLATPGHLDDHIVLYDRQTGLLLTGDTFYPGMLFIRDWEAYRNSIERLTVFCSTRKISAILGAHIEMTRTPGIAYPYRTSYQPYEHILPLQYSHLRELQEALHKMGTHPTREVHRDFILEPEVTSPEPV